MKKAILVVASLSLIIPGVALAHGGTMMDFESADDNFDMMRYVEDQVVGDEVHEEMEDLMIKMMSGEMTQDETQRMVELMDEYPGAGGMMSARMMGSGMLARHSQLWTDGGGMGGGNGFGMMGGFGMMPGFGFAGANIFSWLISLVWLAVGALLVVFLAKKIWK
ncbi:MAG: hypothetical protein COT91_01135 [Candidatus Doudnabacteria bacterium CG10_big_fil_rev_8_21_14_0_10_41_10]|uniref:Uncharacterized protein n=1 Tax=Candidatus Doudnabacteria bacterium CG10_big_fil_rev_8_21_14_0_10_41_10 TaxID=1974551 RepID=A0A2H0VEF6_9BACT|nr:MAG: hypothetical protein COT91_01135 [Candidatus Doudnabacteria bacterium CG10_big_fil_rev_8_21_14_0_10_41_10]